MGKQILRSHTSIKTVLPCRHGKQEETSKISQVRNSVGALFLLLFFFKGVLYVITVFVTPLAELRNYKTGYLTTLCVVVVILAGGFLA